MSSRVVRAGIISAVVLAIVLLILIFLRERILIAIALIKEASRLVMTPVVRAVRGVKLRGGGGWGVGGGGRGVYGKSSDVSFIV